MKGVVFTQFVDFVEQKHGLEVVDEMMSAADLPSGGAYTSVGTYDHQELVKMVVALAKNTETPIPDLLNSFGESLFRFLASRSGGVGAR